MNIIYLLLDILFPCLCQICNEPVSIRDNSICRLCIKKIEIKNRKNDCCNDNYLSDNPRYIFYTNIYSLTHYDAIVKKIIYTVKLNKKRNILKAISKLMTNNMGNFAKNADLVTCVPMNKRKIRKRGFNQSEILAKCIAKTLNKPFMPLIKEKENKQNQKNLLRDHRHLQVIGKFEPYKKDKIRGKNILLVDDVFTTGATLNECSRVLVKNGALIVMGITIANVPDRSTFEEIIL